MSLENSDFEPSVIDRFHFIEEHHQATFSLLKARYEGSPVAVLCWLDLEQEMVRPIGILISDADMPKFTFEGMELVLQSGVKAT